MKSVFRLTNDSKLKIESSLASPPAVASFGYLGLKSSGIRGKWDAVNPSMGARWRLLPPDAHFPLIPPDFAQIAKARHSLMKV